MKPDATNPRTIDELVAMPIPKPLVPKVTALLHGYYSGTGDGATGSATSVGPAEEGVTVPKNGIWTRQDIADLHDRFRNEAGRQVITKIASTSLEDDVVTYGDLMEHSALNEYQLRSQLSWFSKKCKALKGRRSWPLLVTDAGSASVKGTRYSYRMPSRIAQWWLNEDSR